MNSIDILSIAFGLVTLIAIIAVYYALHYRKFLGYARKEELYWRSAYDKLLVGKWRVENDYKELKDKELKDKDYVRQGCAFRRYSITKDY